MKPGDLVYDYCLNMTGVIIERINSVVPWRIFYEDGHIDIACDHDLKVYDESR